MRLTRIFVKNHSLINDLDVQVREHLVIVGANDVGKTSLLRALNLLLGCTTAQLFNQLSKRDLRDPAEPLRFAAWFESFYEEAERLFHREIDIDADSKAASLEIRLEVGLDPEDDEAVTITRWCPGRGEVRALTREQLSSLGWRYLSATRASSTAQLDGTNGAVQVLLRAVQDDLGGEREALEGLLDQFNASLQDSAALTSLRAGMAGHLSSSMPRTVAPDDLAIRTVTDPSESVLDNVSLFFTGEDGSHVSLAEQSDGIRQLMAMTLFDLAEGTANVIAIDEPELHLHPLSQRTVAELLSGRMTQKIVVTHSPYIVQRFDPTQVLAISPDRSSRQIDPASFPIDERAQAHWWSPRMLEALTARVAILVEGVADRLIVEASARARGMSLDRLGVMVFELGGADNFSAVYNLVGPAGFDVNIVGLVDAAESPSWLGAVGGKEILSRPVDEFL